MRPLRIAAAVAVLVGVGGSAVVITAAAQPGDLNGYMNTHREAVQEQLAATTDPVQQAAFEKELGAICSFLGDCPPEPTTTTTVAPSTTTSAPATTTTAPATTTTTVPATTTTPAPTTTTTVAPSTTTTSIPLPTACALQKADGPTAFCDSFGAITGANPASRSGDLDAQVWGVSRLSSQVNPSQGYNNRFAAATLTGCGAATQVKPPRDARVCGGRLILAANDRLNGDGGQIVLAAYPKQPFDIAGRTGTVGFDVSDDSQGQHAAWPEFWWTDQPIPAPSTGVTGISAFPRNSLGVSFALTCSGNQVGVDLIKVTRNYVPANLDFTHGACLNKGSATGTLNHIEIRVSQTSLEVWGSDAGTTTLKLLASASNANLTMTRGLVWVENVHYNACKFNTQCDHEFAYDNLGFDGVRPYRDLSFDVPDANETNGNLGWGVGTGEVLSLHTLPVFRLQTPTSALVTFNWWSAERAVPSVRLNGGPWHDTAWPFNDTTYEWRTLGVVAPVSEVQDGANLVEFRYANGKIVVSNVNVILVAAAP